MTDSKTDETDKNVVKKHFIPPEFRILAGMISSSIRDIATESLQHHQIEWYKEHAAEYADQVTDDDQVPDDSVLYIDCEVANEKPGLNLFPSVHFGPDNVELYPGSEVTTQNVPEVPQEVPEVPEDPAQQETVPVQQEPEAQVLHFILENDEHGNQVHIPVDDPVKVGLQYYHTRPSCSSVGPSRSGLSRLIVQEGDDQVDVIELREYKKRNMNKNTKSKTEQVVRRFQKFVLEKYEDNRKIETIPPDKLNYYVGNFLLTLKKVLKPGVNVDDLPIEEVEYQPETLTSYHRAIARHLKNEGYPYNMQKAVQLRAHALPILASTPCISGTIYTDLSPTMKAP